MEGWDFYRGSLESMQRLLSPEKRALLPFQHEDILQACLEMAAQSKINTLGGGKEKLVQTHH